MNEQEMIQSFLLNNEVTSCDSLSEDEALVQRDTLRTLFDGTIIGRSATAKQNKRKVRAIKQDIKTRLKRPLD